LWGRGRFIFAGWLIPVARSGHANKRCSSVFLAPDDIDYAEGIAGQTWAVGKSGNLVLPVQNLPKLTEDTQQVDREAYAQATNVSVKWVDWRIRKNKACAQSYAGRPIEVNNELWGVLVIDSRSPTLPGKAKIDQSTKTAAKLLGAVLKGT